MNKMHNGKYLEMTPEEIAEAQKQQAIFEAQEKRRPFTAEEVTDLFIKQNINTLKVTDNDALRMKSYYPKWEDLIGKTAEVGFKFQYGDKLCEVVQEHTFSAEWNPETAPSLYKFIDEQHEGTLADPIPYNGNMTLENNKYYIDNNIIYLCIRSTVNPVYNALADLVGVYVQKA